MASEDRTPRNIVEDDDEDVISMGEFENPLADLLVTSDGENIADAVVNAIDRVAKLLDTQNKIFIKMYTVLSKFADNKA
jgi:hypothetical protein